LKKYARHKRIRPAQYKNAKFCSNKCRGVWQSKNNTGVNNSNYKGGNSKCCLCLEELGYRYSRKNREGKNFCKKCSYIYFSGDRHQNWKGGITERLGIGEWRIAVYERDDFTCQKCGDNTGGNLNAHHIENWADNKNLRYLINNGITLCNVCHKSFHKKYGYGKNNVEQFLSFIK